MSEQVVAEEGIEEQAPVTEEDILEIVNDEDVPELQEEIQEQVHDGMKNKTKKRIEGLVKKKYEQGREIEIKDDKIEVQESELQTLREKVAALESVNQAKQQAEQNYANNAELSNLQAQRNEALEDRDTEKINELDIKIHQQLNKMDVPKHNVDPGFDPIAYFKQDNAWYQKDVAKTALADKYSNEVFSDSQYAHMTQAQKLDIVSQRVKADTKVNPYQSASPTDGAPIGRPSKGKVFIGKTEWGQLKQMYPGMSDAELKVKGIKFKKNIGGNK